jgi:hypothetical protein
MGENVVEPPAKDSDVDLFLIVEDGSLEKIRGQLMEVYRGLEKRLKRVIEPFVVEEKNTRFLDPDFRERIQREGVVVLGIQPTVPIQALQLSPYVLVTYEMKTLPQKDKNKLSRELYGHVTRKAARGKVYKSSKVGMVELSKGYRVGYAAIIVPFKTHGKIVSTLKRYGVPYYTIHLWSAPESFELLRVKR